MIMSCIRLCTVSNCLVSDCVQYPALSGLSHRNRSQSCKLHAVCKKLSLIAVQSQKNRTTIKSRFSGIALYFDLYRTYLVSGFVNSACGLTVTIQVCNLSDDSTTEVGAHIKALQEGCHKETDSVHFVCGLPGQTGTSQASKNNNQPQDDHCLFLADQVTRVHTLDRKNKHISKSSTTEWARCYTGHEERYASTSNLS